MIRALILCGVVAGAGYANDFVRIHSSTETMVIEGPLSISLPRDKRRKDNWTCADIPNSGLYIKKNDKTLKEVENVCIQIREGK